MDNTIENVNPSSSSSVRNLKSGAKAVAFELFIPRFVVSCCVLESSHAFRYFRIIISDWKSISSISLINQIVLRLLLIQQPFFKTHRPGWNFSKPFLSENLRPKRKIDLNQVDSVMMTPPKKEIKLEVLSPLVVQDRTYTNVSLSDGSSFEDSLELKNKPAKRPLPQDENDSELFNISPFDTKPNRVKRFQNAEISSSTIDPLWMPLSPLNLFNVTSSARCNKKLQYVKKEPIRMLIDFSNGGTPSMRNPVKEKKVLRRASQPEPVYETKGKSTPTRSKVKNSKPVSTHKKETCQPVKNTKILSFATTIYGDTSARNISHSEEWLEKQELELTNWLNSLLTPPKELECDATGLSDKDIVNLWDRAAASGAKSLLVTAPTKEVASITYHHQPERLRQLQKVAVGLIKSDPVVKVLTALKRKIEEGVLDVKDDIDMRLDQGVRRNLLSLLLQYNPLWLRVGLEAMYGKEIALHSNRDIAGIVVFLKKHFLSNEEFAAKLAPFRSKLHLFRKAMNDYIILKFFTLVFFLDQAKTKRIIPYDPCLFCKNASIKDSEGMLNEFIKEFLKCVGQMKKSLRTLGYVLKYKQTYLDEMDFSISSRNDLRDGVRLARMMEIVLKQYDLCSKLRVPAISKLQKIHNVGLTFSALNDADYIILGDITAKDIVEGHREKTMSLLWQILHKFIEPRSEAAAIKLQRWWKHVLFKLRICNRIKNKDLCIIKKKNDAAIIIQAAWRGYCARVFYKKLNWEHESRMKAATIIQSYFKTYLARKRFLQMRYAVIALQPFCRGYLARISYSQFKNDYIVKCKAATVIQSHFRGYLQRKHFIQMKSAAIKIQYFCRGYLARITYSQLKNEYIVKCKAATVIQSHFRGYLQRKHFIQMKSAAIKIQSFCRGYLAQISYSQLKNEYIVKRKAATVIQSYFKGYLQRKRFLQMKSAAIKIQSFCRGYLARISYSQLKNEYIVKCKAATVIQSHFRGYLQRKRFLQMKSTAIQIQSFCRGYLARISYSQLKNEYIVKCKAATIIQSHFRGYLQRKRFLQMKSTAIKIQSFCRGYLARISYSQLKNEYIVKCKAATVIQSHFRGYLQRKRFLQMKSTAIKIQSFCRGYLARISYSQLKNEYIVKCKAATVIQSHFRGYLQRKRFLQMESTAIKIQSFCRGYLARISYSQLKNEYIVKRKAATVIQSHFRGYLQRKRFLQMRHAVIALQPFCRGYLARISYSQLKNEYIVKCKAATVIQSHFRGYLQRKRFLQMKSAAIKIQSFCRGYLARITYSQLKNEYIVKRKAATVIQSNFRGYLQRKRFLQMKSAAIKIQFFLRKRHDRMRKECIVKHKSATIIQSHFKRYMERRLFLEKKNAAIKIQTFYRGYQARIQYKQMKQLKIRHSTSPVYLVSCLSVQTKAAIVIQSYVRRFLARRRFLLQVAAAKIIQYHWRRVSSPRENGTLRNKYRMALRHLKKCKTVRDIQLGFTVLETVTTLSSTLCRALAKESEFHVQLWHILNTQIRSDPYILLYGLGLNIVLNLARYNKTAHNTWEAFVECNGLEVILILMSKFVKTEPEIMRKACTILWLFARRKEYAKVIGSNELSHKMISRLYVRLGKKKFDFYNDRKTRLTRVATQPDWGYKQSSLLSYFNNPLEALDALLLKLM